MAGRIDFRKIETPTEFQQICDRLLAKLFPDYHPVNQAGGDAAVDGFATWGDRYFQFTHTQGNVPLKKVRADLEKVMQFSGVKEWYFLCSRPLSINTWRFIEAQKAACPFQIFIWDGAVLAEKLSKHDKLVDEFFPEYAKKAHEGTQAIRKDLDSLKKIVTRAKKRPPRQGDAPEGQEIDEHQRQDIYDLIMEIAKYEAKRRHQESPGPYIMHQWTLFKSKYDLSSYDRLPKTKFEEAMADLKVKHFAQRNNEPKYMTIERERKGIHGIAKALGWTEEQRHKFYFDLTGKDSLTKMSRHEIHQVFEALRRLQDASG